ncbi:MAG: hypothetical protein H6739_34900 [Alphaproteobacteria bacterium]|nr:hypothetical protein [Alphaproteobacteria bacterium]
MQVSRPVTLKLDREALLADVRARLEQKLGAFAGLLDDPSDPGWLLVEETAWMVEMLSEQLDRYPWAVLRQLVHLMGGQLRPARPALGCVVLRPLQSGVLEMPVSAEPQVSFTSARTESRDLIPFTPLEAQIALVPAEIAAIGDVADDRLTMRAFHPGRTDALNKEVAWIAEGEPSMVFEHERVRFTLLGARVQELKEALERGVAAIKSRGVGWLGAEVVPIDNQRLALEVYVDLGAAFADVAPGGLAPGGDLEPAWGALDDSIWTPPVRIADDPRLPLDLRLGRPLPGSREGRIRIPDVPVDFPVEKLLVRDPVPMPGDVVRSVWRTLVNADRRLSTMRPTTERRLVFPAKVEKPPEVEWLQGVMKADAWVSLTEDGPARFVHIKLPRDAQRAPTLRLALVDDPPRDAGPVALRAYGLDPSDGLRENVLDVTPAWTLPLPPPDERPRLMRVSALDVVLEPGVDGLLLVVPPEIQGVLLNPLLVGNLAIVPDGRDVTIERTVPTPVSLLEEDLVTPEVLDDMLAEPLPDTLVALLRALELARFEVKGQDPLVDFAGVEIDAAAGELVLNAPDARGALRTLRPGTKIEVSWYRRTHGGDGNVEPGAISFSQQKAARRPRIVRVANPLPTFFGQDREQDEAAVERLFGASTGVPVLAADWEREIRAALGVRGAGWMVRVWTHGERAHLSGALWPWSPDGEPDDATRRLRRRLEEAGTDTLAVFIGEPGKLLLERDLDWARRAVHALVRRIRKRSPTIRDAIVDRLVPLTLQPEAPGDAVPLPCFDVHELRGRLVDPQGTAAGPPRAALLLNAAVCAVGAPTGRLR